MLVLLKIQSELYKRKISSIGKLEQNAYILQTENIEPKSARVAAKHSTFQDCILLYFFHIRLALIVLNTVPRIIKKLLLIGNSLILLVIAVLQLSKPLFQTISSVYILYLYL